MSFLSTILPEANLVSFTQNMQVVCKQLQRTSENELYEATDTQPFTNKSFVLELRGSILLPWVVWRVSAVMQKFHSGNLEARYDISYLCFGRYTKWTCFWKIPVLSVICSYISLKPGSTSSYIYTPNYVSYFIFWHCFETVWNFFAA